MTTAGKLRIIIIGKEARGTKANSRKKLYSCALKHAYYKV